VFLPLRVKDGNMNINEGSHLLYSCWKIIEYSTLNLTNESEINHGNGTCLVPWQSVFQRSIR
jgi:hypothetical protein